MGELTKQLKTRIIHKHKTEAEWRLDVYDADGNLRDNPFVPLDGELIIFDPEEEGGQKRFKFGDGETNVIDLPFNTQSYNDLLDRPFYDSVYSYELDRDADKLGEYNSVDNNISYHYNLVLNKDLSNAKWENGTLLYEGISYDNSTSTEEVIITRENIIEYENYIIIKHRLASVIITYIDNCLVYIDGDFSVSLGPAGLYLPRVYYYDESHIIQSISFIETPAAKTLDNKYIDLKNHKDFKEVGGYVDETLATTFKIASTGVGFDPSLFGVSNYGYGYLNRILACDPHTFEKYRYNIEVELEDTRYPSDNVVKTYQLDTLERKIIPGGYEYIIPEYPAGFVVIIENISEFSAANLIPDIVSEGVYISSQTYIDNMDGSGQMYSSYTLCKTLSRKPIRTINGDYVNLPRGGYRKPGLIWTTNETTDVSNYKACPVIDGVPYYPNLTNTALGHDYGICYTAAEELNKFASCYSYNQKNMAQAGSIVAIRFTNDVPSGAKLGVSYSSSEVNYYSIYYRAVAIRDGIIKAGDVATFMRNDSPQSWVLLSIDRWQEDLSSLATVAKTGSYNDLTDTPTIPSIEGLATEDYVDSKFNLIMDNPDAEGVINSINEFTEYIDELDKKISDINTEPMTSITYSELKSLRNSSKLIPGMFYRITDYQCTTTQENTRAMDNKFDIIVQALSENTLSESAKADYHYNTQVILDGIPTLMNSVIESEGVLVEGAVTPYYYEYIDYGTRPGRLGEYKTSDIFVEYDYLENNEDNVVPVLYKTSEDYIDEGADYQDAFYYIGTEVIDGITYDKWRKITAGENSDLNWGSAGKIYLYTNVIVYMDTAAIAPILKTSVANTDGTLVDGTVVARHYISEDYSHVNDLVNYYSSDIFVEYDYLENNDGEMVPVLYKASTGSYADEGVDYQEAFYYVGIETVDNIAYNKWRKITNTGNKNDLTWTSDAKLYLLTDIIVEGDDPTIELVVDPYFINDNLAAWELKYCLDNDTTRFAWADDAEEQRIINTTSALGSMLARQPSLDNALSEFEGFDGYDYAWGTQADTDDGDPFNFVYSKTEVLKNGDIVYNANEDKYISAEIIEGATGVIYYMKDEWDNECPYDFKNIQFKRDGEWRNSYPNMLSSTIQYYPECEWFYTFSWIDNNSVSNDISTGIHKDSDNSITRAHNNRIKPCYKYTQISKAYTLNLNNNIFVRSFASDDGGIYECKRHSIGTDCYNITIGSSNGIYINDNSHDIIINDYADNVSIGYNCISLTIKGDRVCIGDFIHSRNIDAEQYSVPVVYEAPGTTHIILD